VKYRTLGNTGLQVSEIGLGTWQIGGAATIGGKLIGWSGMDDATSREILKTAFDHGINFFDTSDVYGRGHSEELIGDFIADLGPARRRELILSSKVGNRELETGEWVKDFSPQWIRTGIEGSLKRLKTEVIDVYHLHSPKTDFEYSEEIVDTLESIRKQGKIRFYGVSLTGPGKGEPSVHQGMRIINNGWRCDFFQLVYNILNREVEAALLPECERRDIGVIVRVPLESGFLSGKYSRDTRFPDDDVRSQSYPPEKTTDLVEKVNRLSFLTRSGERTLAQAALQFCLARPVVSTVIAGARRPEQVVANAQASDLPPLSNDELAEIHSAV
jgi:myo-inositol catabolism protein IolS